MGNNRRFYGRKWQFFGRGLAAVRLRFAKICGGACGGGVKKIVVTFGGAGLIKCFDLYGYRRGGTFDSPKVPKSDLG